MRDQHKHIAGYRDLSQEEIDLMNRIKAKGAELLELHKELAAMLNQQALTIQREAALAACGGSLDLHDSPECVEYRRFIAAEPQRWADIGKTDIQTGIMALVRAVAQPGGGI